MQRLYGLRQLGLADRVFIDASHSRVHHVVGVLEQADKLVTAISANLERSDRTLRVGASKEQQHTFSSRGLARLVRQRREVIRLIGLLHDLTHAPFGHTVEDEIQLVETKHDEPARQADAFSRLVCQLTAWLSVEVGNQTSGRFPDVLRPFLSQAGSTALPAAEIAGTHLRELLTGVDGDMARACWRISKMELASLVAHLRCAMTALLYLEALHNEQVSSGELPEDGEYHFQAVLRVALEGTEFEPFLQQFEFVPYRDAYMLDIIGNTVCADLLDYAKRDSHSAGLRLDYDSDRITENFTLVSLDASAYEVSHARSAERGARSRGRSVPEGRNDPFAGWCLRTAISLVSHKYRTDVPSELMNLLNVRFYLYERAIYHPTKCAAGSMLGTALQMLGWRDSAAGRPSLPSHLRFVGDEVFLHDVRAALSFLLDWLRRFDAGRVIVESDLQEVATLDRVHNGLVPELLRLRVGQSVAEMLQELTAAMALLDRLGARRYYRPVFRALPSSNDARLQAGADALADVFRRPAIRYDAERRIETQAGLPPGMVTIHCPRRTTAEKIANVLLTRPGEDGVDEISKLRDIGSLDGPIFGEHENAVQAVERMYGSMWRLAVYVAPEFMLRYNEIGEEAGRVIFETIDAHGHFADRLDIAWRNDPHLQRELKAKLGPLPRGHADQRMDFSNFGEVVGQIGEELFEAGRLLNLSATGFTSADDLSPTLRARIETALLGAFTPDEAGENLSSSGTDKKPTEANTAARVERLIRVFKTHATRPKRRDLDDFALRYSTAVGNLREDAFDDIVTSLEAAIIETRALDGRSPGHASVHHGFQLEKLLEVLGELLKKHGQSPPQKIRRDLLGGAN